MLEVYVSNVSAISNVCWKCFIFHLGWDGRSHVAPLVMQTLDFTQSTPSPREAVRYLNVRLQVVMCVLHQDLESRFLFF